MEAGAGDPRRAAQITSRFRELQGLKQVPIGVAVLVSAAAIFFMPLGAVETRRSDVSVLLVGVAVMVLAFALGVIAMRKIASWYVRKFGSVVPTKRQQRLNAILGVIGVVAVLIQFNIESVAANNGQNVPVNLLDLTFALWFLAYWFYLGRTSYHYLVAAVIGFALGVLSIAGVPPGTFAWHLREALVYIGVVTIIGGVIDHRILTRALSGSESPVDLGS